MSISKDQRWQLRIIHMIEYAEKINQIRGALSKKEFFDNEEKLLATLRCCQVIGEAAKKVPEPIQNKYPNIPWRDVANFRNVIVHDYDGFNNTIFWDVISNRMNDLKTELKKIPITGDFD